MLGNMDEATEVLNDGENSNSKASRALWTAVAALKTASDEALAAGDEVAARDLASRATSLRPIAGFFEDAARERSTPESEKPLPEPEKVSAEAVEAAAREIWATDTGNPPGAFDRKLANLPEERRAYLTQARHALEAAMPHLTPPESDWKWIVGDHAGRITEKFQPDGSSVEEEEKFSPETHTMTLRIHVDLPPEALEEKTMDVDEFREGGYLQEINRRVLHPLGLAMGVKCSEGDEEGFRAVILDSRDDPEGFHYEGYSGVTPEKAHKVDRELAARSQERFERLGYVVQPPETLGPSPKGAESAE
jgi:hypothetical protein